VECEEEFDWKKGKATMYRLDTNQIINVRDINEEDRQMKIGE